VLEVKDKDGNVLEKTGVTPERVLTPEASRQISSILSDNSVRMNSLKPIADSVGRPVAIKTGTTNDYRDVWTVGYTPDLVIGAWAGNNDNSPMQHNVAGLIISPLWGAFASQVAKNYPANSFIAPPPPKTDGKPVLHGVWQGGVSYWIDTISNKLATDYTPQETRKEVVFNNVHSILYWLDKDDPNGPAPSNPQQDSQFENWEYGVRNWVNEYKQSHPEFAETTNPVIPTATDDVHTANNSPKISLVSPNETTSIGRGENLIIKIQYSGPYQPIKTDVYINNKYVLTSTIDPLNISFVVSDLGNISETNTVSVTTYDRVYNKSSASAPFSFVK
jgi:penicillin-binding protein 1A